MVAINTILIIVNGGPPNAFEHQQITTNAHRIVELFAEKGGKLAACTQNVPLTNPMVGWPGSGARIVRPGGSGYAMPLHLERTDWMPSPPLVPDDGPIDIEHLKRMTLGDAGLEREVLAMFAAQAARLSDALAALPADAAELAHTLKGSARGIGAFQVADATEALETAMRDGSEPSEAIAALTHAVAQARSAIDAMLRRS
jgi:HPt (histidine-containing phosphotransfer) domain-containing protein